MSPCANTVTASWPPVLMAMRSPRKAFLERPLAIFLGTEQHGLSDAVIDGADMHPRIPMHGSPREPQHPVSAAIILHAHHANACERHRPDTFRRGTVACVTIARARRVVKLCGRIEDRLRNAP